MAGGYLVHGRWGFSSGIVHADWLIGAFKPAGVAAPAAGGGSADDEAASTGFGAMIVFAIPKAEAEVIDNWHVAGLQGTGSLDFSVDGVFVPAELTYELGSPAVRGGDLFRLGMPAFVSNEVPPLAIGLARRAIDDVAELATHTARFPGGPTVSERAAFHHALGRAEVRVRAARAVHREAMAAAFASAVAEGAPSEEQQLAVTTAAVYAVETCADVVSELFRFGGGRALVLSNPMQRHLRNVLAARQHVALSEENYEAAGRFLLESAKARRSLERRASATMASLTSRREGFLRRMPSWRSQRCRGRRRSGCRCRAGSFLAARVQAPLRRLEGDDADGGPAGLDRDPVRPGARKPREDDDRELLRLLVAVGDLAGRQLQASLGGGP